MGGARIMQELSCKGLSKNFDGVQALDDVTARFATAEIVAIVGPNGAGKTTLLNILTGFVGPDAGACYLGDCDITRLAPDRIARRGIVRTFQDVRLIHRESVLDNVMLGRANQGGEHLLRALIGFGVAAQEARNRRRAKEILQFVGLETKASQPAGELSYGEQKLLGLACALATDAHVLMLDEPVAGVHPAMAGRILGFLEELRAAGKTIVFIEHDMGAVRRIADVVIVMDDGGVIAKGPPSAILDRPEVMEAFVG